MAHSYTPGLRVTPFATLQRRRILPLKGEVTVRVGDLVSRDTVVARTELPGDVATVNVVNRLGIEAHQIEHYMVKKVGDSVASDELIAETRPFFKFLKSTVNSPIDGTVESISTVTGQVILRRPPKPVAVTAYVDGRVIEEIPDEGVVVETQGAFIQGIFGIGGEAWGKVRRVVESHDSVATPSSISTDMGGCVLICGSLVSAETINRAIAVKAAGVIAGGIHAGDLKDLLGYDLGVAITGTERIGTTIIVTEGFGAIAMARRTFDILSSCEGMVASINGTTQIRAGVQRPEIIVSRPPSPSDREVATSSTGLQIGDPVRVIREPYFGRLGSVSALPSDLQTVESETRVRVLEVALDDGEKVIVPRANVESIAL